MRVAVRWYRDMVKILWPQGQAQTLKTRVDAAHDALEWHRDAVHRQMLAVDRLTRRVEELEERVKTHGTR
jgi:ubiquinone biosynthesis protein UbiJ